jgi:hypothetical protein
MDWTEIFKATITVIVGPLLVFLVTRVIWLKVVIEREHVLTYGQEVAIRACDGKYVMVDLNDHNTLAAHERHVKEWEVFRIVHAPFPFLYVPKRAVRYGDQVAFLAKNNQNFVGAALHSDQKELTAWVAHVEDWETFTLLRPPRRRSRRQRKTLRYGSSFALQANNGQNVSYNRDGDRRLRADAPHVRAWEIFVFIDPADP